MSPHVADSLWVRRIFRRMTYDVCFVFYHLAAGRLLCWHEGRISKIRAFFSCLCKQLAASHACTINGHLIGDDYFYLSKSEISSCLWSKQLLVEPSGDFSEDVCCWSVRTGGGPRTQIYPPHCCHTAFLDVELLWDMLNSPHFLQ